MAQTSPKTAYTVKTVQGIINQFHGIIDAAFVPQLHTTLNHKHTVQATVVPDAVPKIRYFGIGIKGNYNVDDNNISEPYIPNMTDMDLYEPIPFRMVPLDEDLTDAERAQYRMRVQKTVGNTSYWAYYLKLLDLTNVSVQVTRTDPENDKIERPYELDSSNLYPTPSKPQTGGVIVDTLAEINVSVRAKLLVTGNEVMEAISILKGGDMRYAKISELGFYSGLDKIVSGYDHENQRFDYTEAIYAQLAVKNCNNGVDMASPSASLERTLVLTSGSALLL